MDKGREVGIDAGGNAGIRDLRRDSGKICFCLKTPMFSLFRPSLRMWEVRGGIRAALMEYCKLDTLGMLRMVEKLGRLAF